MSDTSVLLDTCLTKLSDMCPTVSYDFVRHVSYGVLQCLMVSNKVDTIRHRRTPLDMCLTKMLDTIGHMSDDFVRHMSYKTLVFDIPLLPLGTIQGTDAYLLSRRHPL